MKKKSITQDFFGKKLTLSTGQLAKQATAAVLARMGDTMVLATVVAGSERPDLGYFPLTVEYMERLYAGGRIKGSRWVKREGRPTDDAILTARLIDRSIRPFFPKSFTKEVQVVVTVLSVDGDNEPDVLSIVAVSTALSLSSIPWKGPVSAVRVGFITDKESGKGEFVINPGAAESDLSDLDLVVTQSKEKTLMLEAGAKQVSEDTVVAAIEKAYEANKELIGYIEEFAKDVGDKKEEVKEDSLLGEAVILVEKSYKAELVELIADRAKKEGRSSKYEDLIVTIFDQQKAANPESEIDKKLITKAVEIVFYKAIRENTLKHGKRPDGRKIDEIRPISSEVSILPRTHGSALFQRGDTQSLTIATLGSPRMEQLIESPGGEESKRYMHHYSMPPYSVGETGRMGTPSRREIGHGALAERAIVAVIPKQDVFPYTIRVVSEILSSNGSTSMASVCGSTLALMDAGVPIEKPVAGVAMGLVTDKDDYVILTDILGLEDFSGDMDFKVAGTKDGITAVQLDVKIAGLTIQQIKETLDRAKAGRLFILDIMLKSLSQTRTHISEYAPKIEQVKIPVEKIGEVIGPGGRVIRNIMAETGATIDVDDAGIITVTGATEESLQKAIDWIKGLTRELVVGEVFEGEVKRILPFGAFVEVLPGKEGMVHVSQMTSGFVKNPHDVVAIGQKVKVRVAEIDDQGRVNLSMRFEEPKEQAQVQQLQQQPQQPFVAPRAVPVQEHPLSMQFRRERAKTQGGGWRGGTGTGRRSSSGTGRTSNPRFKKTHY